MDKKYQTVAVGRSGAVRNFFRRDLFSLAAVTFSSGKNT